MVLVVLSALAVLTAVGVWLRSQPPRPDEGALRADIVGGRSGAEATFAATVIGTPTKVGDHEHIQVQDRSGDQLELDYNLQLGQWIPVSAGDSMIVRGQLYIDQGRVGVHCLHSRTSRGCPLPGWIQAAGKTYS